MNETDPPRTRSIVRKSRWPGWIWAVPIAAVAIVGWFGIRAWIERGTDITVTFSGAPGVQADNTTVEYRGIKVGTVEGIELSDDLHHVSITLRMAPNVTKFLTQGTRFWLVGENFSLHNLSALKTIISGPYIEMEPGTGKPARHFVGLKEPPPIDEHVAGTTFLLHADRLGSISTGSPVYYLGLQVGTVTRDRLAGRRRFEIAVFVRHPYDELVHDDTRFWDASAVQIGFGNHGVEARLASIEALFAGGVAFRTPERVAEGAASKPDTEFPLYHDEGSAQDAPQGQSIPFLVRFPGAVGDLGIGAAVKLRGFRVGEVTAVSLAYNAATDSLETPATIEIEPARLKLEGVAPPADGNWTPIVDQAIRQLVAEGLRAELTRSPPIVGGETIALDIVPNATPATLGMDGIHPRIPAAPSAGLDAIETRAGDIMTKIDAIPIGEIGTDIQHLVGHLDTLVASPAVSGSLRHLDHTLAELDRTMQQAGPNVAPLIGSLRRTADSVQQTAASAGRVFDANGTSQDRDLPDALREMNEAAQSIRALADYLDRHPGSLLRGRVR